MLIGSFILQIAVAVGIAEWLSLRSGERAANSLALELSRNVGLQVANHLETHFKPPFLINRINQDIIQAGLVSPKDLKDLSHLFWQQTHEFNVSHINFGTPTGEFVGAYQRQDGSFGIDMMLQPNPSILKEYATDPQGNPTELLKNYPYNHRRERWYTDAVSARQPIWSEIYQWDKQPEVLAISASFPLYDRRQNLIGVLGVDQTLSDISKVLHQIQATQAGVIFVVEQSGLLVASSGQDSVFQVVNQVPKRIYATDSQNLLIRATAQFLVEQSTQFSKILTDQNFSFRVDNQDYFIQVLPWRDQLGLDWRIIVVLPVAQFMGEVYDHVRYAILLSLIALVIAAYIAILTARWITNPVQKLNQTTMAIASVCASDQISQQRFTDYLESWKLHQTPKRFSIQELDSLSCSFDQMAQQLQNLFFQVEQINHDLEQRVEERTLQLQKSEGEKEMNQCRLQLQQMVMMELSKYSEIHKGNLDVALKKVIQLAAHTLDIEQVSIWFYNVDHSQVECSDLYTLTTRIHSTGGIRVVEDYATYFKNLEQNSFVSEIDARTVSYDPEFLVLSLNNLSNYTGNFAILDIPICSGELTLGVLHLEHLGSARQWQLEEQNFAAYLAHMISLAMEAYDHTETEIALRQNEELFRQLTENIESVLWMSDPQTQQKIYVSPAYEKIWGRPRREIYQSPQAFFKTIYPEDQRVVFMYFEQQLYDKCDVKYRIVKPDGEIRWIYDQAFPIKDEVGQVYRVSGISADITDRKRSEEQIQTALKEKEILLKEIHHRVKNNLHIISNLLDLQSDSIQDEHLLHLFEESQNRIRSMALVHEQLYQSDDLGKVNFGDYIHRLVENIFFSLNEDIKAVQPIIEVEPIQLNLETAIPCGLIINELVTNCFKHAFLDQPSREVHIELYQDEQQKIHLRIWDNGIGIPPEINWEDSSSLGLKLVRILSKQLRGELHFNGNSGTLVSLVFSQLQYKSRF
ncbi:MAG: histidine kinase dimerization/phosphoacceptor domain -containing protein [Microcoleaceae cyanobacterium]